jgi:replicative DNA helicase Mcm
MGRLRDLYFRVKGLSQAEEEEYQAAAQHLAPHLAEQLHELLTTRKAKLIEERFPVSANILPVAHVSVPLAATHEPETVTFCNEVAKIVRDAALKDRFYEFAPMAQKAITERLAPHLVGMAGIKEAVALQLAMPERFHILLLGDPGTGKTDLLRAAVELAPVSSFGLGSGSSKAGLAATVIGKEVKPGLLVQAHGGVCALDELNLLKTEDRGALYNAMEKGFVSYDKGGVHKRFEADVRVLATANPTGDRWKDTGIDAMRKQLPFDPALLSRFHLVFIVRRPGIEAFRLISERALSTDEKAFKADDAAFLKAFLTFARTTAVTMPVELESTIIDALMKIKEREDELLIEITPRLVKGVRSLALANARLGLRKTVNEPDIEAALAVVHRSLELGLADNAKKAAPLPKKTKAAPKKKVQKKATKRAASSKPMKSAAKGKTAKKTVKTKRSKS